MNEIDKEIDSAKVELANLQKKHDDLKISIAEG